MIQLMPAEVLEVIYEDKNPSLIYAIKAKVLDSRPVTDAESPSVLTAIPLNFSYIRVPIVGEVVLVLQAPSSYSTSTRNSLTNYYLDIVSLQASVHHNAIPTVTKAKVTKGEADGNSDHITKLLQVIQIKKILQLQIKTFQKTLQLNHYSLM